MKELFLSKTNAFFCDARPNDEFWFPEVAGYEKISIFISVLDLDTQEKNHFFEKTSLELLKGISMCYNSCLFD